jgi:magnesium-transporting ATPase (P-type)
MDKTTSSVPLSANRPVVTAVAERPWHALDADAALQAFASGEDGLDSEEATARLTTFGPNRLPRATGRGPLTRFLLQFHNVLIYALLAAVHHRDGPVAGVDRIADEGI